MCCILENHSAVYVKLLPYHVLIIYSLAAMIKGNKVNCSQFVAKSWTDMFIKELTNPTFTHGMCISVRACARVCMCVRVVCVRACV